MTYWSQSQKKLVMKKPSLKSSFSQFWGNEDILKNEDALVNRNTSEVRRVSFSRNFALTAKP